MGDPEGIGPEIIGKALKRKDVLAQGSYIVFGDKSLLKSHLKSCPKTVSIVDVPYRTAGEGSLKFLDKAIEFVKGGIIDAVATAPLSKERVAQYSKGFKGHTEYLADAFNIPNVEMMFVANQLRVVIVTRHEPLAKIPSLITSIKVTDTINLTHQTLVNTFKIKKPKIAVLGLNPHAGENGLMGLEEERVIKPVIARLRAKGMNVNGPFPADTFFAHGASKYDATIAMYHDQGLTPIKTMYFDNLVNTTIGLPFVRTCPAHGTAFDIAGKNRANPSSMAASLILAHQLA